MTTNDIPTIAEVQEAKLNMDSITEFIQSTMDTLVDQYGGTRKTLTGVENEVDQLISDKTDEFDAAIATVGANTVGDYSTNPVLTNANDTAYYSGDNQEYKTKEGVSRPYTCDSTTYPDPNDDPNLQKYNQRDQVTSIAALQARGTESGYSVYLSIGIGSAICKWDSSDLSEEVALFYDILGEYRYYIPKNGDDGTNGAWVYQTRGIITPEMMGAVGDGVTPDTNAIKAVLVSEMEILGRSDAIYLIDSQVLTSAKSINADWRGATFYSTVPDESVMRLTNEVASEIRTVNAISDGTSPGGDLVNVLEVSDVTDISSGDILKVFSNDLISTEAGERVAEFVKVNSVDGTDITLENRLVFSHQDNPRYVKFDTEKTFKFENAKFDTDDTTRPYGYLYVSNYFQPQYNNLTAIKGGSALLYNAFCFMAHSSLITALNLTDDSGNGNLGYGVVDFGSQESVWESIVCNKVRHAYTTGAPVSTADEANANSYGGAVRCKVLTGNCINSTNLAWDTHPDAVECYFGKVFAANAPTVTSAIAGGFQDRGRKTILDHLIYKENSSNGWGLLFNLESDKCVVNKLDYYGEGAAVESLCSVDSRITIKELNYYSNDRVNYVVRGNSHSFFDIEKINIYMDSGFNPQSTNRVFRISGGGLSVKQLVWNLVGLSSALSSWPILVSVDASPDYIEILDNTLFVDDNSFSVANMLILDANSNNVNSFKCRTKVHYNEYAGQERSLNGSYIRETVDDENILTEFDIIGTSESELGSVTTTRLTGVDIDMYWGQDYSPLRTGVYKTSYHKIVKYVVSTSSLASVASIAPPSFEGQEVKMVNSVSESTHDFVIPSTCTGVRNTSDVTVDIGQAITLVARDVSGVLEWEVYT